MTITEAGYVRDERGQLDADNADVQADVAAIKEGNLESVRTAPGKLVAGMVLRSAAGAGPITLISCDNVPDNGATCDPNAALPDTIVSLVWSTDVDLDLIAVTPEGKVALSA